MLINHKIISSKTSLFDEANRFLESINEATNADGLTTKYWVEICLKTLHKDPTIMYSRTCIFYNILDELSNHSKLEENINKLFSDHVKALNNSNYGEAILFDLPEDLKE